MHAIPVLKGGETTHAKKETTTNRKNDHTQQQRGPRTRKSTALSSHTPGNETAMPAACTLPIACRGHGHGHGHASRARTAPLTIFTPTTHSSQVAIPTAPAGRANKQKRTNKRNHTGINPQNLRYPLIEDACSALGSLSYCVPTFPPPSNTKPPIWNSRFSSRQASNTLSSQRPAFPQAVSETLELWCGLRDGTRQCCRSHRRICVHARHQGSANHDRW